MEIMIPHLLVASAWCLLAWSAAQVIGKVESRRLANEQH